VLSCTILSPLGLSNNTYSSVLFFSPFLTWNQSSRLPDPAATLVVGAALPLGESILLLGTASPVPNLFFSRLCHSSSSSTVRPSSCCSLSWRRFMAVVVHPPVLISVGRGAGRPPVAATSAVADLPVTETPAAYLLLVAAIPPSSSRPSAAR